MSIGEDAQQGGELASGTGSLSVLRIGSIWCSYIAAKRQQSNGACPGAAPIA